MRKSLLYLAVMLLLGAPTAALAAGTISISSSSTISAGGATLSDEFSLTRDLKVMPGQLSINPVSIVVELEEIGDSFASPHHNVGVFNSVDNAATVTGNLGVTTVQQQAGVANVTLGVNTIVVGGVLGGSGNPGNIPAIGKPASEGSNAFSGNFIDPTTLLSVVLNPGFAIINSKPVAELLLAREAINVAHWAAMSGASTVPGILVDVLNVGVNEFSPHHNVVVASAVTNTATVSDNQGITTVQQQAGGANVQTAINTIIAGGVSVAGSFSAQ